jgi:transposase
MVLILYHARITLFQNLVHAVTFMKKLSIKRITPDHDKLVELYKTEKNSRLKERYHALALMHELKSCYKVAKIMKRSDVTIQSWVKSFNTGGLPALVPSASPGRPSRLSMDQKEELKKDVLTHPRKLGCDFSNWKGKNVSEHVKNKFGVLLKVRQCQYLLHELGFTLQRPRYAFPKANRDDQEQFVQEIKKRSTISTQTI